LPVDLATAAEEEREPEHEQQVPDHGSGQRAADDLELHRVHCEERDDQLRRVPEGRVEEAADPRSRVLRCVLGRLADQPRERDQRRRREHELERLRRVEDVVHDDHDGGERDRGEEDATDHGRVPYRPRIA
jgi:hypothetical protein